ncbi:MAG: SDR family oxidoreductase, partial [bacterium]
GVTSMRHSHLSENQGLRVTSPVPSKPEAARPKDPKPRASVTRVLITGIGGFLGWNMATSLKGHFDEHFQLWGNFCHHALALEGCHVFPLDLTDGPAVKKILDNLKPAVVFHTAAMSQPDRCEREPEQAFRVNVEGTENLLSCLDPGVRFLFLSTDLVFDGKKGWYQETDQTNPLNTYANTKLEAEKRVQAWNGNYAIVRVSLMYGYGNSAVSSSFLDWLSRNLKGNQPVSLFTDQYRTCLLVQDAAEALFRLSRLSCTGIFHLGGAERINRYEFGKKFAGLYGYPLDLIRPVLMQDVASQALRAADCSLRSEKMIQTTGFQPCDVESGLRKIMPRR